MNLINIKKLEIVDKDILYKYLGPLRKVGTHTLDRCRDRSMVRFLRIDPMISGLSPTAAKLSLRVRRVTTSL